MSEWDLGRPGNTVTIAAPPRNTDTSADPVEELFRVTPHERGVVVRAMRPHDLADLTFIVRGYQCLGLGSPNTQPRLRRMAAVSNPKLKVLLPSQHVAEEIRDKPSGEGACESAASWGASRVRLSQPSRLVFNIPDDADWRPALRISALTDWSKLEPIVHRRAGVGAEVEQQLGVAFPNHPPADWAKLGHKDAHAEILAGLTAPGEGETTLEVPGRLILSPSAAGRWIVPGEPEGRADPLWAARLDRTGRASVRAIWSSRLEPGKVPQNTDDPADAGGPMLSLSLRNHWEIVAQTSVYGLAALRRLGGGDKSGGSSEGVIAAPPPSVVRPQTELGMLAEIDRHYELPNQDSGIALATPFDDADLSVTPLGAIAKLEWKGEPPIIFWPGADGSKGLSLERLSYRGFLGRDTKVVAAEKGYLFPLGIRASLVTVHERHIYPDADGNPVSYLIRRQFIATPRRPRSYPGPYQPFEGRAFPPRRLMLKTLTTPDLAPPKNICLGADVPLPDGSVFWPQVIEGGQRSDVLFEWATEDAVAVRSKLIFVLNEVVPQPAVMSALVGHYNGLAEGCRTAWLGGARHRYAEPLREGDTSFDTTSWVLAAQGRRDGPNETEHFAMDGRMEGADQPPFYPIMESGLINVQSIEQMLGTEQGHVEVCYFEDYLNRGISTTHGIYLKLAKPDLDLPASNSKERSGGLASPDLKVAALSRITGLVGGSAPNRSGAAPSLGSELDFSDAVKGAFNPEQFFDGAKLLGVVELKDIVAVAANHGLAAAPRLIEQVQYGARDVLSRVQAAAKLARQEMYGSTGTGELIAQLETAIAAADTVLGKAQLTLSEVYPSLMIALQPLRVGAITTFPPDQQPHPPGTVKTLLDRIVSAPDAEGMRAPIAILVPIMRDLLAAAAAVIKDPVPDAFEAIIAEIQRFLASILDVAADQVRLLKGEILTRLMAWLRGAFCDAVDTERFGAILFGERGKLSCQEIFRDPEAALQAFLDGFYGAAFNRALTSLQDVLESVWDLRARLDLLLEKGRSATLHALRAAVALIEHRLAPLDPMLEDVRTVQRQAQFCDDLLDDLRPLLAPPGAGAPPEELLAFATIVAAELRERAKEAIEQRIAELLPAIHAAQNVDPQELLAELASLAREHLNDRFVTPLQSGAEELRMRLTVFVENMASEGFDRLVQLIVALFDALLKSSELASIARAGRSVQEICEHVAASAQLLGDAVMAPSDDLRAAAQAVIDASLRIIPPAGPVGAPLRNALAILRTAAGDVIAACSRLEPERAKLRVLGGDICAATRDHLDPLAAVLRIRREALSELIEMARQCDAIGAIFSDGSPTPDEQAALRQATRSCAGAFLGISGAVSLPDEAATLRDALRAISGAQVGGEDYRAELESALAEALRIAEELQEELAGVLDPARLLEVLEAQGMQFQRCLDRQLVALLMQSAGFTQDILDQIDEAVVETLGAVCSGLLPLYDLLAELLGLIINNLPDDPVLAKVYKLALGGDAKFAAIQDALDALRTERAEVEAIGNNPTIAAVVVLVEKYRARTGALTNVVEALTGLGLVDVGQTLTQAVREQLKLIEGEVRALVLQFVPTRIETRYFWTTELRQFPRDEGSWIIKPGPAAQIPPNASAAPIGHPAANGQPWHLWLDARFSFDMVTRKRDLEVAGVLRPFELRLLGGTYHMLTIAFDETRFRSVNGGAPKFDVKVSNVTIGPFLEFIKTLEQWLAPQGSGFYLRPADGFRGIEVGYVYDAGIIQVGSLQFINVAFRVAAILPFSDDEVSRGKAKFVFTLASEARPFLISSPPYGGGGWVRVVCDAEQVQELDLAFVFGGVAAIQFGPLNAQGRIVAGIRVQSLAATDGKRAYVVTAIFEAVGEGSVACFSISVSIRVTLTQQTGGALYGETTYRFTFKVGFVRLKYSVTARYRLSNDKHAAQASLTLAAPGDGYIRCSVPPKESQWLSYRDHFDLTLLKDAA